MADDLIFIATGDDNIPQPGWDLDFNPETMSFDWSIADPTLEPTNAGGLKALEPMKAAILMQLFSDARRPDGIEAPDDSFDRRGWHGDDFDIDASAGERPIGSLLWTLARGVLTPQTVLMAETYAMDALRTLIDQGVASRIMVRGEANQLTGRLVLHIAVLGAKNEMLFADSFSNDGVGWRGQI